MLIQAKAADSLAGRVLKITDWLLYIVINRAIAPQYEPSLPISLGKGHRTFA